MLQYSVTTTRIICPVIEIKAEEGTPKTATSRLWLNIIGKGHSRQDDKKCKNKCLVPAEIESCVIRINKINHGLEIPRSAEENHKLAEHGPG
jgi:hypothetical protein